MDKTIITESVEETQQLGEELAKDLTFNFLALYGELGAGKTSFIQGLAIGLGIKERIISPTFILIKKHATNSKKIFYHIDFYRVDNDRDINEQLIELLSDQNNIIAVEWAEKLKNPPAKRMEIWFRHLSENQREIKFRSYE